VSPAVEVADGSAAEAPPGRSVLSAGGVHVSFGGIKALDNVAIEVRAGEVCGLIGPNGAGKTTLFDVISGVRVPNGGTVVLDGRDVTSASPIERSRLGLRRTFQAVQVFSWLSVLDNVVAALDWEGGGGGLVADLVASPTRRRRDRERRERAREALARCGLSDVADAPAGSLPVGLARMVELARATVDPPKVLLLDEPTSGLDPTEAGRLAERIAGICRDAGCGVLLVEHDMEFTMNQCQRLVVLHLGQVIATGTPEEIRGDAAVRAAYLGA
jgi:branched-chain amino acid transport system ATP-binding protein